jgi:synaptobrevin family protein YKT6
MKIYAMYIMKKVGDTATIVDSMTDFTDIGFFYRGSAIEVCHFIAKQLAASPSPDRLTRAQEKQFMFHKLRVGNAVALLVATEDYPSRVVFGILQEIMHEYDAHAGILPNNESSVIRRGIREYQQPGNADKITRIQENLEETRNIMTKNLQLALVQESKKPLFERLCNSCFDDCESLHLLHWNLTRNRSESTNIPFQRVV